MKSNRRRVGLLIAALTLAGRFAEANLTSGGSAGQRPHSVLSVGDVSACALLANGTVNCWGENDFGQLGAAPDSQRHAPALVNGITNAVSVGMGRFFGCALSANGQVQCWGDNGRGWLGDGTPSVHYQPKPVLIAAGVPLGGIKALSVGVNHSCAVNSAGQVLCWGANGMGQLGTQKSVGDCAFAVVVQKSSGGALTGAVDVAVGNSHSCALGSDGSVWCWGHNGAGQLGDGTNSDSVGAVPSQLPKAARALTAGMTHSCAVLIDGTVACWGSNRYGEAGDNKQPKPSVISGITNVKSLSGGASYTCAVNAQGDVYCWGLNHLNQLTLGPDGLDSNLPLLMGQMKAVAVSAGRTSTCAAIANGTVQCWGNNFAGEAGDPALGKYSSQAPRTVALTGPAMGPAAMTSSAGNSSCALHGSGVSLPAAKCWGFNGDDEVGDGSGISPRLVPVLTAPMDNWPVALTGGMGFSCALQSNGSGQCWGQSNNGALGNGSTAPQPTPKDIAVLKNGIAISAGNDFVLALVGDGTVLSWGDNSHGQLGDGTTLARSSPVVAGVSGVTALATGGYHSCALTNGGAVWCWGYNGQGQLGVGDYNDRLQPNMAVPLTGKAVAVSAGWYHSCALLDNGTIQCWGYDAYGQLGDGSTGSSPWPVNISSADSCAHSVCAAQLGPLTSSCDSNAAQVCALDSYCCAQQWDSICVNEASTIAMRSCTGGALSNQAVGIAATPWGTCALNDDGSLACWGYDGYGELGNNSTNTTLTKAQGQAWGLGNVSSVSGSAFTSCASRADGTVWCWGYNGHGELGNGTTTQRTTPGQVGSY